jgi:CMD domain protein
MLKDPHTDIIDGLAKITPGSALASLRDERQPARTATQESFDALFEPVNPGDLGRIERDCCALRVAMRHGSKELAALYRSRLDEQPDGAVFAAAAEGKGVIGLPSDLAAILAHADRLTLDPGAVGSADLAVLRKEGLTTAAIVTLSQVISFVAYQARVLEGLRLLGESA